MRNHISQLILGSVALLFTQVAMALGLGDLTLKSHLDQPLEAEIRLLEVRELTEREVLVELASPSDFERLGVDRNFFLTSLKFDVVLDAKGGPVVKVSTDRPVREPFLNFVLQARWPTGRLLREYTVLLDLPVFSDDAPAPLTATQSAPAQRVPSNAPAAAPRNSVERSGSGAQPNTPSATRTPTAESATNSQLSPESLQPRVATGGGFAGDSYRVERNDTLWEIALRVRPDSSVSIHQTMLALQRSNPQAFINNNINLLKSGQVLRIPNSEEMRQLAQAQAMREVAQQNSAWRGNNTESEVGEAPLNASGARAARGLAENQGKGRVSLSAPRNVSDASGGRSSGSEAGQDDGSALRAELDSTLESLDLALSENRELRDQIEDIEAQIGTLESMIAISSDNLRALELSALVESETQSSGVDTSVDEQNSDAESDVNDTGIADTDDAATAAQEEPIVEEQTVPVASPAPFVPPPAEPGIVDLLIDNILFIGLGILVLVLAAVFILRKRRAQQDSDDFEDFLHSSAEDQQFDFDPIVAEPLEETLSFDEDTVEEYEEIEAFVEEEEAPQEPETEDVVAESDIYIAYGKYDQAEDMLRKALEKDPDHHAARLKLMEIQTLQNRLGDFDKNYAVLLAAGVGAAVVQRAKELRESFGDAPAYGVSEEPSAAALEDYEEDDSLSFDLDLGSDDDLTETQLDLTAIDDQVLREHESASPAAPESTSAALEADDFDLDFSDFDTPDQTEELSSSNESLDFDSFDLDSTEPTSRVSKDLDLDDLDALDVPPAAGVDLDFDLEDVSAGESEADDFEFDLSGLEDFDKKPESALDDSFDSALDSSADRSSALRNSLEADLESLDFDLAGELDDADSLDTDSVDRTPVGRAEHASDTLIRPAISESEVIDSDLDSSFDLDGLDAELEELSAGMSKADIANFDNDFDDFDTGLSETSFDSFENEDFESGDLAASGDLELDADFDLGDDAPTEFDDADLDFARSELEDEDDESLVMKEDEPQALDSPAKSKVMDFQLPDIDPDANDDADLDFLADSDEVATKLDLAAAYIDMGDNSGAREIIDEILQEGNTEQQGEAKVLLDRIAQ